MNRVRNRLAALFFVITAAAIGFVYLYVVPQLRSSLTSEKLDRLEQAGAAESGRLTRCLAGRCVQVRAAPSGARRRPPERRARDPALGALGAGRAAAQVRGRRRGVRAHRGAARLSGSRRARPPAAAWTRDVEEVAGTRTAESAVPLLVGGRARWVAVLSTPLDDVDDSVALIRRQILIAGLIALAAALAVGWIAARAHAKRLRRLEAAAEKVAEGDFSTPIPDEGTDEVGELAQHPRRDATAARPARQRPQGVHRQRLSRAAHADLLAGRLRRVARRGGAGPGCAGGVRAHDARAGEAPHQAHRRPPGPLEARRRRAPGQRRTHRPG